MGADVGAEVVGWSVGAAVGFEVVGARVGEPVGATPAHSHAPAFDTPSSGLSIVVPAACLNRTIATSRLPRNPAVDVNGFT